MFVQWWVYTERGNIRSLLALANYKTKTYRCPTCLPRCKNTRVNMNYGFWECLATWRMFLHALSLSARPFATNNDVTTPSDKASRISHHKYSRKSEQKIKEYWAVTDRLSRSSGPLFATRQRVSRDYYGLSNSRSLLPYIGRVLRLVKIKTCSALIRRLAFIRSVTWLSRTTSQLFGKMKNLNH